jgi:hypothetical protein
MGYEVQLLEGDVQLRQEHHAEALRLVKEFDLARDDLKSGWRREETGEKSLHWPWVRSPDIQSIEDLASMLRAFRFEPWAFNSGDIGGVEFTGENRGAEIHLWRVLAPFVDAGGRLDWYGEDGVVERWRFDGVGLQVVPGTLAFEDDGQWKDEWDEDRGLVRRRLSP